MFQEEIELKRSRFVDSFKWCGTVGILVNKLHIIQVEISDLN